MTASLGIAWRWSQLLVAIAVVIVEWVCREVITVIFRVIPVPWRNECTDDPKHGEDPNCERGTIEYIEAKGYHTEEHFATTPDGYILGLHRIPASHNQYDGAEEIHTPSLLRPVLIVHGFMHSSEAFIRHRATDSLPLVLHDSGYDVWLGNNRGNKYSHKHVHKKPNNEDFWDFSLDDMARYDLPTMIDCVLAQTGAPSLTLIGFSQGTAQGFAYLSSQAAASSKINLFIALAPVIVPRGFANPVVDSLARARPDFIFLLFGKRQLLPATLFWRNNLPRARFGQIIDLALKFLFGWDTACIADSEKTLLYSHIYSHASVKTVVQWFQIIQTSKFQMFDDYKSANISSSSASDCYPSYVLPQYQVGQIKAPIACFCGGRDTLPHTSELLASLPTDKRIFVHIEEKYEHLDFMWASDVAQTIYPKILTLLKKYNFAKEDC
jgi:lysosomal acid lipase/cholesteryl ester hydrolase